MAAIALPDIETRSQLTRLFCIVFVVGLGVVSLFAYRKWMAMKAKKQTYEVSEVS
ncbi:hypothetical protein FE257_001219 [Aspergillus nanangensis]|uniref:Uncharacterized protein n=1 Tax=Aspergillus nanangensis TaxID=2582783 RepID=A0AAD4GQX2_ASPNN|nr:hypothetical protein FE257_001219 [Aspergillus nanangensis]